MKHLATTIACLSLVTFAAAGCGDSSSRARPTAATIAASEPVSPVSRAPSALSETGSVATVTPVEDAGAPEEVLEAAVTPSAITEPVAEPATPSATPSLEVLELTMARGVERHRPVGAADSFVVDGSLLYAYMRIANPTSEDQTVVVTYEREDGIAVGPARLSVPADSRGWRTFTRTGWVRHPGQWTVSVHSTDGDLLGQAEFTLES